jgi:hypothetical protein
MPLVAYVAGGQFERLVSDVASVATIVIVDRS